MPLSVKCDELRPGMKLYEPIIWGDQVLVRDGKTLNDKEIGLLRKRFPDLYVRIRDDALESAVEFEDHTHARKVATSVKTRVLASVSEVGQRFTKQSSLRETDLSAINESISAIVDYLTRNPVSAILLNRSLSKDSYVAEHTSNVFYLSMVLGYGANDFISKQRQRQRVSRDMRRGAATSLTPLGLGTMFMDLGLMRFEDLFKSTESLSFDEWQAVRDHPITAARMLPDGFDAEARAIVLTHHENMAGTGYPEGRPGEKLQILSKIVRIADAYETATAQHIHPQAKSTVRALWEMMRGPYRFYFDPDMMVIFSRLVHPFPIGAKIQLEDGRWAVIVRYNQVNPFQPYGIIAFDEQNERLSDRRLVGPVPLGPESNVRLKSFRGEDLLYLYQRGSARDQRGETDKISSLFSTLYP